MKHIKKGKITLTIVIGIACIALTTVMFMQFKMVNQTDIDELEVMREEELRAELAEWKNKYEEAENQYNSQLAKLEEYNQKEESETETDELVQKELDEVNLLLGKTIKHFQINLIFKMFLKLSWKCQIIFWTKKLTDYF